MVAARLGCKRNMVGTGYTTSHPGSIDRLTKHYWKTLSGCMTTESADYCMLVNEWTWLRSQVCILRLEVDLSSVLVSELVRKILGSPCVFVSQSRGAWERG